MNSANVVNLPTRRCSVCGEPIGDAHLPQCVFLGTVVEVHVVGPRRPRLVDNRAELDKLQEELRATAQLVLFASIAMALVAVVCASVYIAYILGAFR